MVWKRGEGKGRWVDVWEVSSGDCGEVVGVWLFVVWDMFLCLNQIWGYVYQCMYHSFAPFAY
jgi:hypothetical protein